MIYTIENELLTVQIHQTGAELYSIKSKADGTEYVYQGNARAYFLFPIIGFIENDELVYDGVAYPTAPHGFVKSTDFTVVQQSTDAITLQISDTEETKKHYPFSFTFSLTYQLKGNELEIACKITNNDARVMHFSYGQHPGFTCPIDPSLQYSDYYLEFNKKETVNYNVFTYPYGYLTQEERVFLDNSNIYPLSYEAGKASPFILNGLNSDEITLKSDKSPKSLTLKFKEYPCCSLWAPGDADFMCIQPWQGSLALWNSTNDITKKDGMRTLEPNATFACAHQIVVK